jgi:glyoxylase I family protein
VKTDRSVIKSIEHIAILASDPGALARWYCETLAFTVLVATEAKGQFFVGLPEGGVVEFLPANDRTRAHQVSDDAGIRHIAFTVDDYDASARWLEENGVEFNAPHKETTGGNRMNFFNDPEGNLLQLVWRPKPLGSE